MIDPPSSDRATWPIGSRFRYEKAAVLAHRVVIKKRPKSIRFAVSRTDTTEEEEEADRTSGAKSEVTFGSLASAAVAVEITVADEGDHEFA